MTPQELKNSILYLAIQGKLVEQRSEEGTAEELFQQIQEEKQRLIKEKKIKKEKPLPEITDDEKPFDIPDRWKWVRLKEIATLYNGRAYKQAELLDNGKYPILRVGNLFTSNKWYYSDMELEDNKYCDNGDLLYSWSASFGPHIWNGGKVIYHYHIWKIAHSFYVHQKYLYYFLLADTEKIKKSGHGLAMIHVTKDNTERRKIPLPPLAEQKRIVAKIEEILPYIDRYEKAWTQLEEFNKKFPDDMKKSILQYAIQGKLVEQRREEGTAEELYQQIQKEKQRLIKEKKIKKEKPLPEITDDEKPFDIPDSWKWVRLGEIFQHNTGKALNSSNKNGNKLTYITTSNLYWEGFKLENLKEMYFTDNEEINCTVKKGDLLVCEGGDVGRSAIWNYDFDMRIQNHIHRLRSFVEINAKYFYFIMYLYKFSGRIGGKGIGIKGLSSNAIHSLIVPLPPLAEQKRIVEKLDELLPLCDKLK